MPNWDNPAINLFPNPDWLQRTGNVPDGWSNPTGWNTIAVHDDTPVDYSIATLTVSAQRAFLTLTVSGLTISGEYTFYAYIENQTTAQDVLRLLGQGGGPNGAEFTGAGWYAVGVVPTATSEIVRVGAGPDGNVTGTIVVSRPCLRAGFVEGITVDGELVGPLTNEPGVAPDTVIDVSLYNFTLASFIPSVGISVNANVPLYNFALALNVPSVGTGANVIIPNKDFTLSLPAPLVGISVNIKPPIKDFTLALQAPAINIIGSVSVPIQFFTGDNIEFFAGGFIDFFDTTGLSIHVPLRDFILEFYPPLAGVSTNIVVPGKNFSLNFNIPTVNIAIDIKLLNVKGFGLEFFSPIIHSVNKPKKFPVEIDLTPPFDDTRENRYLHKNFDLIKDIVKEGATGQFTTVDGRTVHVRHGIIVDIFE